MKCTHTVEQIGRRHLSLQDKYKLGEPIDLSECPEAQAWESRLFICRCGALIASCKVYDSEAFDALLLKND